jgi:hypothetical protein
MLRRISVPLGLIAIAATPAAFAGNESPWSASFTIGSEMVPDTGRWQSHHAATIANLGTIDPRLAGQSGAVTLNSQTFKDVYRAGPSATFELGYDLTSQFSTFARLSYMQLRGRTTRIGDVIVSGQPLPSEISGRFDDVHSWGLNLGGRYFLTDSTAWRPYFAGYVGAERAEQAQVRIRVDGTPVTPRAERLLPRETRLNAGVEVGINYDFSEQAALRFSVGADYRAARHEDSNVYQPFGLSRVRISDADWTIPVELGLTYKFLNLPDAALCCSKQSAALSPMQLYSYATLR